MSDYNGWKNRETWNVSLWLNNDYDMYLEAVEYMKKNWKAVNPYRRFIYSVGLQNAVTGDNIMWISGKLDYNALNNMMRELIDDTQRL